MSCCFVKSNKRAENNIRRYRRNSVHPIYEPYDKNKPIKKYVEDLNNECIECYHCKKICKLHDNEIKILCSECNNFFHCHIAGKCRGKDCTHITTNSTHTLSYCLNCVDPMTIIDDTCLCNSCVLDEKK